MQASSWPANCPETLYDICLEYCALNLDKTVCHKSASEQLVLRSEVFLPQCVSDALLSRLHPVGRKHLPLLANPMAVNCRHMNLKSITDLTDAELQNVFAHQPTDLRLSSIKLTDESLNLINAGSHNLQTLHIVKCENIFSQRSRSRRHSWKEKFRKDPAKRGIQHRFHCPKARYMVLCGVHFDVGENLCSLLSELKLLTRLDLSDSTVTTHDLHAALAQLQMLQILSLHGVKLEPSLRDALEAIAQVKSLRFVIKNFPCVLVVTVLLECIIVYSECEHLA